MKKFLIVLIAVAMLAVMVSCSGTDRENPDQTVGSTVDETTSSASATFTLIVEGNDACIFCDEVELPESGSAMLSELLSEFDKRSDKIEFTGISESYVTAVNGETAGKFGGWDGWLYRVNGVDAMTGINETSISEGDVVTFYYGDPYGVGMAFPEYEVSGKTVTFTSAGAAIAELKVKIGNSEYVTDAEGKITVTESGEQTIQVEKKAENGLTLVLRFPPETKITIGN